MSTPFEKFTVYEHTQFGHEVFCVKGLWGVSAPTKRQAMHEAVHYFEQYYADGEYDE